MPSKQDIVNAVERLEDKVLSLITEVGGRLLYHRFADLMRKAYPSDDELRTMNDGLLHKHAKPTAYPAHDEWYNRFADLLGVKESLALAVYGQLVALYEDRLPDYHPEFDRLFGKYRPDQRIVLERVLNGVTDQEMYPAFPPA